MNVVIPEKEANDIVEKETSINLGKFDELQTTKNRRHRSNTKEQLDAVREKLNGI